MAAVASSSWRMTLPGAPITTEVQPLQNYSPAEAYHQDYFANNPHAGYCAFVVGPKVEKFRKTFARYLKG